MPTFTVFKGTPERVVKKTTATKPDGLTGDQVYIKTSASGLCGTDLHFLSSGIALGHEGVGIVEAVGPGAKYLKIGDRVGWGYHNHSCGNCYECLDGHENYCAQREFYGEANQDQGSFSSHVVWSEAYVHKIPEAISDVDAAPLQCAGATIWNALQGYDARPNECIGIMGMGGLGHLAISFASCTGAHVIVLSGSDSKKEEALKLGAHEFVAMKGKTELTVSRKLNRLLVVTSAQPDWELILSVLAPRATIHPLSVASGNFEIPYMPLIMKGITVQGSAVAPRKLHRQMMDFAALHGIRPVTETFPMTEEGIADAIDKLEKGQIHFRAVLLPQ